MRHRGSATGARRRGGREIITRVGQTTGTAIRFTARLEAIDSSTIVRLPEEASGRLPSRGQVAVKGSMNGREFRTVLEPDGLRRHWMKVEQDLRQAPDIRADDIVSVAIETTQDWPEPDVPSEPPTIAPQPRKVAGCLAGRSHGILTVPERSARPARRFAAATQRRLGSRLT